MFFIENIREIARGQKLKCDVRKDSFSMCHGEKTNSLTSFCKLETINRSSKPSKNHPLYKLHAQNIYLAKKGINLLEIFIVSAYF